MMLYTQRDTMKRKVFLRLRERYARRDILLSILMNAVFLWNLQGFRVRSKSPRYGAKMTDFREPERNGTYKEALEKRKCKKPTFAVHR
jgi:hypothetical protein